ncbi:hypothetical protein PoB_000309000 [Plakobranchus ocellatus]|uniref:Uncharacterized protein n=1 Tax=Plakobranchus ocellatus TaxID=259542 RepID=A0AAV3Y1M3_9GAST|nr:hypothetical protein PoB_000309000 [Plakobranchus ocellatus]
MAENGLEDWEESAIVLDRQIWGNQPQDTSLERNQVELILIGSFRWSRQLNRCSNQDNSEFVKNMSSAVTAGAGLVSFCGVRGGSDSSDRCCWSLAMTLSCLSGGQQAGRGSGMLTPIRSDLFDN